MQATKEREEHCNGRAVKSLLDAPYSTDAKVGVGYGLSLGQGVTESRNIKEYLYIWIVNI